MPGQRLRGPGARLWVSLDGGARELQAAGAGLSSVAVSSPRTINGSGYAAGTIALVNFGTSVQPSICWQMRTQTACFAFGTA